MIDDDRGGVMNARRKTKEDPLYEHKTLIESVQLMPDAPMSSDFQNDLEKAQKLSLQAQVRCATRYLLKSIDPISDDDEVYQYPEDTLKLQFDCLDFFTKLVRISKMYHDYVIDLEGLDIILQFWRRNQGNADITYSVLGFLESMTSEVDIIHYQVIFETKRVIDDVFKAFKIHHWHCKIQRDCMKLIGRSYYVHNLKKEIIEQQAIGYIIECLSKYASVMYIQESGLKALTKLLEPVQDGEFYKKNREFAITVGARTVAAVALSQFSSNSCIQKYAILVLCILMQDPHDTDAFETSGPFVGFKTLCSVISYIIQFNNGGKTDPVVTEPTEK